MYGIRKAVAVWCLVGLSGFVWERPARADGFAPFERIRIVRARITAYCSGACCCGRQADGVTSTGRDARLPGAAVAPDAIPYGYLLWIPGAGYRLADDTGGAMRTSWRLRRTVHVDLRMVSHSDAKAWGVRELDIALYRPVPTPPPAFEADLVAAPGSATTAGASGLLGPLARLGYSHTAGSPRPAGRDGARSLRPRGGSEGGSLSPEPEWDAGGARARSPGPISAASASPAG